MDESLIQLLDSLDGVDPLELSQSILMANYGAPTLCLVRGNGVWVYDTSGKAYLDFLSGIAVTSLGHAHPKVARALSEQAEKLVHVSNIFANEVGPKVAIMVDRLIRLQQTESQPGRVFFANSGAESNEAAIKLVRRYGFESGRNHIVAMEGSFHGRTLGALSATGQKSKQIPFEPLVPGFSHVPWSDLDALKQAITQQTVAVMIEPIQGEAGVIDPISDFLKEVRSLCDDNGILMIVDEVQTGFGRTGEWFGFQHHDILPDVVTLAKAMGSGMPIGACWAKENIASAFMPGDHGTTYGGQPLAASAALATIRELIEIDAPRRARERGAQLVSRFEGIDGVKSVSGSGLLRGINLEGHNAKQIAQELLLKGLIVNPIGDNVIRLAPPIIVTSDQVDSACELIIDTIREIS